MKIWDVVILLFSPIAAALLSSAFNVNAFVSVFLFFGIPSLYLSLRNPMYVKRAALFALAWIPLIIMADYIAHITQTWFIPDSVNPYRLFGLVTIEILVWMFLNIYLAVLFYEVFLDRHKVVRLKSPHIKYFFAGTLAALLILLAMMYFAPQQLLIPYWYLVGGTTLLGTVILVQFFRSSRVFWKIVKTVPYFLYLCFTYEIIALKSGWWSFPGNEFIGWVTTFGVRFPLEEFIFWFVLLEIAALSYYELLDDDER